VKITLLLFITSKW